MAFTKAQLDSLEEAIAMGSRRVKYEDKEVEYPSLASMQNLRERMMAELGIASPSVRRRVQSMRRGV